MCYEQKNGLPVVIYVLQMIANAVMIHLRTDQTFNKMTISVSCNDLKTAGNRLLWNGRNEK